MESNHRGWGKHVNNTNEPKALTGWWVMVPNGYTSVSRRANRVIGTIKGTMYQGGGGEWTLP